MGLFGQRLEFSQAIGIALARWILGRFLGSVCHCFSTLLDFLTFATSCLHVHHDARDSSDGRWNCGRECCPSILPRWRLPRHLGIFYMPQIYDIGPRLYFPSEGRRAEDFFAFKNQTASAGFESANLGTKGQHTTPRPPKPLFLLKAGIQFHHEQQVIVSLNGRLQIIHFQPLYFGAFSSSRKSHITFVMSVRPSDVCPPVRVWGCFPPKGFSRNLV